MILIEHIHNLEGIYRLSLGICLLAYLADQSLPIEGQVNIHQLYS